MNFNLQESLSSLLPYLLLCCALPSGLLIAAAWWSLRAGQRFLRETVMPGPAEMQSEFQALSAAHPSLSRDALVEQIIRRQSFKCGLIGAFTGFGGLPFLPITLPIDLYASLRVQAAMVNFIALAYGHERINPIEQQAISVIIMTGSREVAERSAGLAVRIAARVFGRALSKLIPVISAVTGFAVNYWLARAVGRAAVQRYRPTGADRVQV